MAEEQPVTLVDWDVAARVGARIGGDGPQVSATEARDAVAELRAGAERSTGYVRDFTGLSIPETTATAPLLVVDRPGWVRANAGSFATIMDPVLSKMAMDKRPGAIGQAIGSRMTGSEVGAILGFLSGKVLGQFDPFHAETGRLMLLAPNVVQAERDLDVDPHDFRLWVCLHEETHRVQFTAVPWMRDHVLGEMQSLLASMEPAQLRASLPSIDDLLRARREGTSVPELVAGPERREAMDRITGFMSLLEGHADVVMDGVGPQVIPSVAEIRRKFTKRRQGVGLLDKVLRRLLGLDAKMAQYRDGAVFVRSVIDEVGMDGFNEVWAGPHNLPSRAEILEPGTWVRRVHG